MSFFTPGAGRQAIAGGGQITFKFGPDDGAKDLSMFESVLPPVGGAFPHLHREFEEAFYVLEGEVRFLLGDEWYSGPRGTAVHVGPVRDGWVPVKYGDGFASDGWLYRGAIGR